MDVLKFLLGVFVFGWLPVTIWGLYTIRRRYKMVDKLRGEMKCQCRHTKDKSSQ
jgi:hypothetical protein